MLYNEHAMAILYSPRRFWPVFSTTGCPEVSASAVSERWLAKEILHHAEVIRRWVSIDNGDVIEYPPFPLKKKEE